ncbi:MAG: hypothetical protein GXY83_38880 [Rhodopirellula sp.]|nr:hypothetical protein [Rhodopirellula sp.]
MRSIASWMPGLVVLAVSTVFAADSSLSKALSADGDHSYPYLTTPCRVTLLSANDGEIRFLHTRDGTRQEPVPDSITVIRLGPDHPPVSKTIAGTVPSTIYGAPHIVISADGRFGFVTNHSWRYQSAATQQQPPAEHLPNLLTVIDLAADDLSVLDQVKLPAEPWMVDLHPDGQKVIVAVGAGFHVYSVETGRVKLASEAKAPNRVTSFDVSPRGDRIVCVTVQFDGVASGEPHSNPEFHLFSLSGDRINHLHRINAVDDAAPIERLFSPRISPDGKRAIVLQDWGIGGKGTRDDVLIADLEREVPAITERVRQVADGLEGLAFHPSGRFAVISCLEKGADVVTTSHLAVIDLATRPARLVSHIPIEPIPEGIEFTPDGSKLFVGTTLANHIVVFDVDGFMLGRSPFVLPTGHAPSALALWSEHVAPGTR